MQMKNDGYEDAMLKLPQRYTQNDYIEGYRAGGIDLALFKEHNDHSTQESFRYVYTRAKAHIRNIGVVYVYLMPNKKVLCKSNELAKAKIPEEGRLVGVYTDDHPTVPFKFADFKEALIEAMMEVYSAGQV